MVLTSVAPCCLRNSWASAGARLSPIVFDPLSLRIMSSGLIFERAPDRASLNQKSPARQTTRTTAIAAVTDVRVLRAGIGCFQNSGWPGPSPNMLSDFIRVRAPAHSGGRHDTRLIPDFPV